LAMRIVRVAADVVFQGQLGGEELAVRRARERVGVAFDPEIVACLPTRPARCLGPGWAVWCGRRRLLPSLSRSLCSRARLSIVRSRRWGASRT
jgi:hypothetical protein